MKTKKDIEIEQDSINKAAYLAMNNFIDLKHEFEELASKENLSCEEHDILWALVKLAIWSELERAYEDIN